MNKFQVIIIVCVAAILLRLIFVVFRGKRTTRCSKIDADLNIKKNRVNWWRDNVK